MLDTTILQVATQEYELSVPITTLPALTAPSLYISFTVQPGSAL